MKDSFSVVQVLLDLSGFLFSLRTSSLSGTFNEVISDCSFVWFFHLVAELGQMVPGMAYMLPSANAFKEFLSNSVFY